MAFYDGPLAVRPQGCPVEKRPEGPSYTKALEICRGPATDKVFVRGLPSSGASEDALKSCFGSYGAVKSVQVISGEGCAFVQYESYDDAEAALTDPAGVTLGGQKLKLARAVPQKETQSRRPLPPQDEPGDLEFAAIRGHCTASAIGTASRAARAGTATYVVWDRNHIASEEKALSKALNVAAYDWDDEEKADVAMGERLMNCLPTTPGRRALFCFVSDQQPTDSTLGDQPLWQDQGLITNTSGNYIHNMKLLNVFHAYQPWVHASRAATFVVIPANVSPYPSDITSASCAVHRIVMALSLQFRGCGWVIGLQNTSEENPVSAQAVFSAVKSLMNAGDATRDMVNTTTISLRSGAAGDA